MFVRQTAAQEIPARFSTEVFINGGEKAMSATILPDPEAELKQIVQFACTAVSLSTQKHGGISSVPDDQDVPARI